MPGVPFKDEMHGVSETIEDTVSVKRDKSC